MIKSGVGAARRTRKHFRVTMPSSQQQICRFLWDSVACCPLEVSLRKALLSPGQRDSNSVRVPWGGSPGQTLEIGPLRESRKGGLQVRQGSAKGTSSVLP